MILWLMLEIIERGNVAESPVLGLLLLMELARHHLTSFDPLAQASVVEVALRHPNGFQVPSSFQAPYTTSGVSHLQERDTSL